MEIPLFLLYLLPSFLDKLVLFTSGAPSGGLRASAVSPFLSSEQSGAQGPW